MRAVLKYPGAKWSVYDWIISHFPEHHSYLEPYFGSGAVLFSKPRSNIETVNDLDGDIVNLFDWIRHDPERLAREIMLTPYSRDVYEQALERRKHPKDSFDRAMSFYTCLMMGFGFRTYNRRNGWKIDIQGREKSYATKQWLDLPDVIQTAAQRLMGVQIEDRPALEVIRRFNFPNVLIYCDPPYMTGTRREKQYACEMTDKDHEALLDALLHHKGFCVISGYDSGLYNDVLRGWYKSTTTATDQLSRIRNECLWMNFEPFGQMRFDEVGLEWT